MSSFEKSLTFDSQTEISFALRELANNVRRVVADRSIEPQELLALTREIGLIRQRIGRDQTTPINRWLDNTQRQLERLNRERAYC